jgi:hypothetical protein
VKELNPMALIYGKAITAEEVERVVSRQFTSTQFASLCNAIVWATSNRQCISLPSFTERVNVKDGGIDAEWSTDLTNDGSSQLLGNGWNVFQYKQRDITTQDRDVIFKNLKGNLKGAIKSLHEATGRRPDKYVVFLNIDLTHPTRGQKGLPKKARRTNTAGTNTSVPMQGQKDQLKKAILSGYDLPDSVIVEIIGAAEIATFLNDLPHLRLGFFQTESFHDWQSEWQAHTKEKMYGSNIKLIGRDTELNKLHTLIGDENVRAIILTGPHNIGKTRLVLQATEQNFIYTIVALDPRSMKASDLLVFESATTETIVIIEDPEPNVAEEFARQAVTRAGIKLLITLPTAEQAPNLNFGQDSRIQALELGPLSDAESHKLLQAAGPQLDYNMEAWLVEQSAGNPGILLLAASLGAELRNTAGSLFNKVGMAFERKIQSRLGDQALKTLCLLSLMTHVGLKGSARHEIEVICTQFGDGQLVNTVLNDVERLLKAGVLRAAGSYVEVIPPLFANRLALSTLRGRITELYSLLIVLNQSGRLRLLRRLEVLKGDEVDQFWDKLLGSNGPLKDPVSLLANDSQLLRLLTDKAPERVAPHLENWLKALPVEERRAIGGGTRRELIWILEQLLFRRKTSLAALRSLALLAEAEAETISNNATGVFCECFSPDHPQLPLSLRARLDYLKAMFAAQNSIALRQVGIKAIKHSLEPAGTLLRFRRSRGPEPFDPPQEMTYGEIYDYIEALAALLLDIAQSNDPELSHAAGDAAPRALMTCAYRARPAIAVAHFRTAVELVVAHKSQISVAKLVESLHLVHESFSKNKEGAEQSIALEYEAGQHQVAQLLEQITTSDFVTRLSRWVSEWTRESHEHVDDQESSRYRFDVEIESLAREVAAQPTLLTDEILAWLCSPQAERSGAFFWALGKADVDKLLLAKLEGIGGRTNGATPFAAYISGIGLHDRPFCVERLDTLVQIGQVTAETIVIATAHLGGDLEGVLRLEALIQTGRITPLFVQQAIMYSGWLDSLKSEEFYRLLTAIAGSNLENAMAVIELLNGWLHSNKALDSQLVDFAWRCLEAAPEVKLDDSYDCENLAAHLVRFDIERGFRLFDSLLRQPYNRESWLPGGELQGHNALFWNALHQSDAERALRMVFTALLNDTPSSYRIDLDEIIDQEADANILIALAYESEEQTLLVCQCLKFNKPLYWHIISGMLKQYPNDDEILHALTRNIMNVGMITWEPGNEYDSRLKKVEQMLNDAATSTELLPLLSMAESVLRNATRRETSWYIDREINGWGDQDNNPDSLERLLAIRELIRAGKESQVRKLLSKDELQRVLPQLDLSQQEKSKIDNLLDKWD